MDCRSDSQKRKDWRLLLLHAPADAITLLRIDRHPPMVTFNYDDSDD